jgi:hypothetical protein
VTADVADEVHLDVYDLFADVAPGQPAVLVFEARITGSFRLELSAARLELLRLEVA